jgi:succinate dehydrogenase hydrophobic anchor subunit
MSASERVVYGRSFRITQTWLWIAQRASALLLGPLVLVHVWGVEWSRHPVVLGLLLLVIAVHGYSGLRRVAPRRQTASPAAAAAWAVAVLVFGGLIVLSLMERTG